MDKIRNWLLVAVLSLLGSIEMFIHLFDELAEKMNLPPHYPTVVRIVAFVLTVILVKKEPPSRKKAKLLKHRGIDIKKSE